MGAMTGAGNVPAGLFNLKFERLALVTHRQRPFVTLLVFGETFATQISARLLFNLAKYSGQL